MLSNAQSPYSSHGDASRSMQIALLIPVQRFGHDVILPDVHFPVPVYPEVPAVEEVQQPEKVWLAAVERELGEMDELAETDGLPLVHDCTRTEAVRILKALNPQPIVPAIYAEESAVVIHFKAPRARASVAIEIRNDGQGDCYSHIDGTNKSLHYGTRADIPDEFVKERLRALSSAK